MMFGRRRVHIHEPSVYPTIGCMAGSLIRTTVEHQQCGGFGQEKKAVLADVGGWVDVSDSCPKLDGGK